MKNIIFGIITCFILSINSISLALAKDNPSSVEIKST